MVGTAGGGNIDFANSTGGAGDQLDWPPEGYKKWEYDDSADAGFETAHGVTQTPTTDSTGNPNNGCDPRTLTGCAPPVPPWWKEIGPRYRKWNCFKGNFTFAFKAANTSFLEVFNLPLPSAFKYVPYSNMRKVAGLVSAAGVARATGLTNVTMGVPELFSGGVANLGVKGTMYSMGANVMVNAVIAGAAFEAGVTLGAAADATGQTLAGSCR